MPERVLSVDDDPDTLRLIKRMLGHDGLELMTADTVDQARALISRQKPDLILLDVHMPGMDGYAFCAQLQESKDTACIPVIFLTAAGEEQGKARALAVGGVDYLTKPIKKDVLVQKVRQHLATQERWKVLRDESLTVSKAKPAYHFVQFKEHLFERRDVSPETRAKLAHLKPSELYQASEELGLTKRQMAKLVADFLKIPYVPIINPDSVQIGVLPTAFCRAQFIVSVKDEDNGNGCAFVLSNPFNPVIMDVLKSSLDSENARLMITEPHNINSLLGYSPVSPGGMPAPGSSVVRILGSSKKTDAKISKEDIESHPIVYLASNLLYAAVAERASDIHIEPKERTTVVRFRIDGDMQDMFQLENETGVMLLARLKAIGGLDIADKRRPQDGSVEAVIDNKNYQLRLATTSTPYGESMIIRVLSTSSKPKLLAELGMSEDQARTMLDFGNRTQGLLLIVGPTGSGKSTTVYSMLSQLDSSKRSVISVEDPVEYRISFVNQQQVNAKAGITFESLLKSSVRQDPDILFIGEIRDPYSARIAVDFASTGHLTIATLHTPNATSAVFRLERLGITRAQMADSIIGIVAQRILKKLCTFCRRAEPVSEEEKKMFAPFTNEIPSQVAHPGSCAQCNNTGYYGREGVYEILTFDPAIAERVRSNRPLSEIRSYMRASGSRLISQQGIEKVRSLVFSPQDLHAKVLADDIKLEDENGSEVFLPIGRPAGPALRPASPAGLSAKTLTKADTSVLVVEDESDSQQLIARLLEGQGYSVTLAGDGVDALLHLGRSSFDLIIADIDMPHLDGMKLLDLMNQKGIRVPLIFLTSHTEPEQEKKGLELGAADYIHKPIQKETFLTRVKRVLQTLLPAQCAQAHAVQV